jgi:hypothetical protein
MTARALSERFCQTGAAAETPHHDWPYRRARQIDVTEN